MQVEYLIALSVFAGICATGLAWFGWELLQNLWELLRASRAKRNLVAQAAAIGRRATDVESPPETPANSPS